MSEFHTVDPVWIFVTFHCQNGTNAHKTLDMSMWDANEDEDRHETSE